VSTKALAGGLVIAPNNIIVVPGLSVPRDTDG